MRFMRRCLLKSGLAQLAAITHIYLQMKIIAINIHAKWEKAFGSKLNIACCVQRLWQMMD
jgi:hypothetical protein